MASVLARRSGFALPKRRSIPWQIILLIILPVVCDASHNRIPGHHLNNHGGYNFRAPYIGAGRAIAEFLEGQRRNFHVESIKKVFSTVDDLFMQAVIKVQTIDKDGKLGQERISTLFAFLTAPHDLETIREKIETSLSRVLSDDEKSALEIHAPSLMTALNALWNMGSLEKKKVIDVANQHSLMSPNEIIRLLENGTVKTKSGYFVQLRTGSDFGDPLKLSQNLSNVISKFKEREGALANNLSENDLLSGPYHPKLQAIFDEMNMPLEVSLHDYAIIEDLRRYFLFMQSLQNPIFFEVGSLDYQAFGTGTGASLIRQNIFQASVSPGSPGALLFGSYYLGGIDASLGQSFYADPLGLSYSGSLNFDGYGPSWWLYYSEGFMGGGLNYSVNLDQGTLWSKSNPSYLFIGLIAGGWRDYLTAGVSFATMFGPGIGFGVTALLTVSRNHDVLYLGEYPLDGKFSELRGLHKIEINQSKGFQAMVEADFSMPVMNIPLPMAFRGGVGFTKRRVYRTHTTLEKAQSMLSEENVSGISLIFGRQITESKLPSFQHPENLKVGDELVESKIGQLNGAFILGMQSFMPIPSKRVGGVVELTGEFELGIKRMPNNKFEVSIEPKKVFEIAFFATIFNIFRAGNIKTLSVARKQIFIFDFYNPEAKKAYFDLIHHGNLPLGEEIEISSENRGPEYLLTEFRAQNKILHERGIARTYLEKIRVHTSKKYVGINIPLAPTVLRAFNQFEKQRSKKKDPRFKISFEGIDREFITSHAKSVATNGLISVSKSTFGGRKSAGQGFHGRFNQDLFVTHRRVHTLDEHWFDSMQNRWGFDSLVINARIESTKVAGNKENKMAQSINKLFSTFFGSFEWLNSKSPRVVTLERTLFKRELELLLEPKTRERVPFVSQMTGISQESMYLLLKELENKHPDHQGLIVKHFVETSPGIRGFAAIHQLLGARQENLFVRTEAGYAQAIANAKKFIAQSIDVEEDGKSTLKLTPVNVKKHRKEVKKFFINALFHLQEIDLQLRLLADDKYLLDEDSPLIQVYGEKKVNELINAGTRQDKSSLLSALISARKMILALLDLEKQGYNEEEQLVILQMAEEKNLRLSHRIQLFLQKYEGKPISINMPRGQIKKRLIKSWSLISEIDNMIRELDDDLLMQKIDGKYVLAAKKGCYKLRKRLSKTTSLSHLKSSQRLALKEKFEKPSHNPVKRIYRKNKKKSFHFDGALANAYRAP